MKNFHIFSIIIILFSTDSFANTSCEMFPLNHILNTSILQAPISKNSEKWLKVIGRDIPIHPDFGSGKYNGQTIGIPINYVKGNTRKYDVLFKYDQESDLTKYPIPKLFKIEGGMQSTGDRHIITLDTDSCLLYELFNAHRRKNGQWIAGSGAVFNLKKNHLRKTGYTSADAAGLAIYPALVKYHEVQSGKISHALRFTLPKTAKNYIWPARHFSSTNRDLTLPPMGMRLRLKSNIDISSFSQQARIIAQALKEYGMILADNGGKMYISGEPNKNWNNSALRDLKSLKSNDFEVVDVAAWQSEADSGRVTSKFNFPQSNLTKKVNIINKPTNKAKYFSVYYVSQFGNDENNGTSESPWRTLQHAADLSEPGDIINVERGSYSPFKVTRSGKKGQIITFDGNGSIIDGHIGDNRDGIEINQASYIKIKNFKIEYAKRAGISAIECDNITLEWNELLNNQKWGVFSGFCNNLNINNNIAAKSKKEHGIYVSNTSENIQVYNNESYENNGSGIQLNGDKSMGGKGIISNAKIFNNKIYNNGNGGGAALNLDGVQNSEIFNNIIYDNFATGIAVYKGDAGEGSKHNSIMFNTVIMPKNSRWCVLFKNDSSDNTFMNNICLTHHTYRGSINIDKTSLRNFKSDYNALTPKFTFDDGESIYSFKQWQKKSNGDNHSIMVNDINKLFDYSRNNFVPFAKGPIAKRGIFFDKYGFDFNSKERTPPTDIGAIEN